MLSQPLKVAIIGTGYVAQRRAEALQADSRVQLNWVSGHKPANIAQFCQNYGVNALERWQDLVTHPEVDLVIICSINSDHAPMTRLALASGKHVVVEYPLALDAKEGQELVELAKNKGKFLHIEHLELLGELHQTLRQYLPELGQVFYAKYTTVTAQRSVSKRWNFEKNKFGFPLISALSRISRFTDLFGQVTQINCQSRWWNQDDPEYFHACLAQAQLHFSQGMTGEILYAKGDLFWLNQNEFDIYGEKGILSFKGDQGQLITEKGEKKLELGSKRGLFAKDTRMVIDHLLEGTSLYVTPPQSVYALEVATAAQQSAQLGQAIIL